MGTENLEYEMKKGVRLNRLGFDELESRFGRTYKHLIGLTLADCRKVCEANGLTDKALQEATFRECNPVKVNLSDGKRIDVIEDVRRLKRIIKREHLIRQHSNE
jgi:hypothetical protein